MLRDDIIDSMSVSMELSKDLIEKVILFQGEDLLKAVKQNHSIEISGFGKFILSQNKLNKKIRIYNIKEDMYNKKLESDTVTDTEKDTIRWKKISLLEDIEYLKSKINE